MKQKSPTSLWAELRESSMNGGAHPQAETGKSQLGHSRLKESFTKSKSHGILQGGALGAITNTQTQ